LDLTVTHQYLKNISVLSRKAEPTAMVGMLLSHAGTKLYHRLVKEGRLLEDASGDNTAISINFKPKMESGSTHQQVCSIIFTPSTLPNNITSA
jgi:hypothetical protein